MKASVRRLFSFMPVENKTKQDNSRQNKTFYATRLISGKINVAYYINNFYKMNSLITIRKKLAFGQEDMARFLGIKRSMLIRAENGVGDLPASVYVQLKEISDHIYISERAGLPGVSAAETRELEEQKSFVELQARKLERELREMQEEYASACTGLKVLESQEKQRVHFPTWQAVMKDKLLKKCRKNSPVEQARLGGRIAGLRAEANCLRDRIAELRSRNEKLYEEIAQTVVELRLHSPGKVKTDELLNDQPGPGQRPERSLNVIRLSNYSLKSPAEQIMNEKNKLFMKKSSDQYRLHKCLISNGYG